MYKKVRKSFSCPLCFFFVCPLFLQSSPFFTLSAIIFCFYRCALSCILQSQLFCIFQLNSWAQFSCYCIPKGCFFSPMHKLLNIFNIPFHCEIVGDGYLCIVISLMQFLLFCNCFCLILVLYYFLSSCCFTKICVFVCACIPFHDEAIGNHYLCYSNNSLSLILTLLCFCDI